MEALKKQLALAKEIIAQQNLEIVQWQEKVDRQQALILRLEADQETDKTIEQAKIDALTKLLEDKKRARIMAAMKLQRNGPPETPEVITLEDDKDDNMMEVTMTMVNVDKHQLVGRDPKGLQARYPCVCGKIYHHRFAFQNHVRVKTSGKIFRCDWCPKKFDVHGNLKAHVENVHHVRYNLGKFACGKCGERFDVRGLLMKHQREITCRKGN